MAGDWIKMAPKLHERPQFRQLEKALGISEEALTFHLYRVAHWFHTHSEYGQMHTTDPYLLDFMLKVPGFSAALQQVGWLRIHNESMTLFGFTEASAVRKSLGAKVRAQVLAAGKCAACGATDGLVVDHIIPIVRGGSSRIENLQALCAPCNRAKGRKLPTEWDGKNG